MLLRSAFSNVPQLKLAAVGLLALGGGLAAGIGIGHGQRPVADLGSPMPAAAAVSQQPARKPAPAMAPECNECGVVESVRAVQVKGAGTGVGAVAGGVVGAALGNQIGKGSGRAAMTVLGAVGGGAAGHEIERHVRSETIYEVRVRMDDGSVRTLRQRANVAPGTAVTVQGGAIRVAQARTAGSR